MIYFIESGWLGPIKIGYTNGPVEARLRGLSTAHHQALTVLLQLPGDLRTERELHERYARHRLRGEWFKPAPDLLAFICDQHQPPDIKKAPYPVVTTWAEWQAEALRGLIEMVKAINSEDTNRFRDAYERTMQRMHESQARDALASQFKAMLDAQVKADEETRQRKRTKKESDE